MNSLNGRYCIADCEDELVEIEDMRAEPQFFGGTGDISTADVDVVRAFVVRNPEPLLSYWNEKISFGDLLATLR